MQGRNQPTLNGIGAFVSMAVTSADDKFLGLPELRQNDVSGRFLD
jgi:hypothetical protein